MLVIIHVLLKWLNRLHWILHLNYPDVSVSRDFPLYNTSMILYYML